MAAPKSMVETGGPTGELRSFRKSKGGDWICNVDRLTEDVQAVASWLCEKIGQEADEDRITDTLCWMLATPEVSKPEALALVSNVPPTISGQSEVISVSLLPFPHPKP